MGKTHGPLLDHFSSFIHGIRESRTVIKGLVVRKPINANPRLKVNRGFRFS